MSNLPYEAKGTPLVEIQNLRFSPEKKSGDDIPGCEFPYLELTPGHVYALIGGSGCGKSLLLNLLATFPPNTWKNKKNETAPSFRWFGKKIAPAAFRSVRKYSEAMRCGLEGAQANIWYLPQNLPSEKVADLSVKSALTEIVRASVPDARTRTIEEKAEAFSEEIGKTFFDWEKLQGKKLGKLSGGERKRFEICARIIALRLFKKDGKALFLLDEPTAGLDCVRAEKFFEGLRKISENPEEKNDVAFVVATHDLEFVKKEYITDIISVRRDAEDDPTTPDREEDRICCEVFCGSVEDYTTVFGDASEPKFGGNTVSEIFSGCTERPAKTLQSGWLQWWRPRPRPQEIHTFPANEPTEHEAALPKHGILADFRVDFRRIFRRQWLSSPVFALSLPAVVAVLVWFAFLFQGNPGDDLDRFVFFSTLYCFWCGLFNACQTLNGARESGEWQYWVLGFRRSFLRYFTANTLSVLLGSLAQAAVFLGALFVLSFTAGTIDHLLSAIQDPEWEWAKILPSINDLKWEKVKEAVYDPKWAQSAFGNLLKVGYDSGDNALTGFLGRALFFPKWLPALGLLSLAFSGAVCCGVSLGILLSALLKRAASALKTAVAIVVLVMISSTLVLDESKTYEFASELVLTNETKKTPFPWKDKTFGKTILSFASFAFPQRYFFNLGFCALHKSTEHAVEACHSHTPDSWKELGRFGRKCGDKSKLEQIREDCFPSLTKIFLRRISGEIVAMALWCFAILAGAFLFIKKISTRYYDIR